MKAAHMTEEEMRKRAWDNALHCHGTYTVFSRRLRRLKSLTKLRDFWGFAIPIILGVMAGSSVLALSQHYQEFLKIGLAVAALVQILIALWAVFSRWDDALAYSSRAARDAHEMEIAWKAIGEARVDNVPLEFKMRTNQQSMIDSHDIQQEITSGERNLGMRSGLIEFRRPCAECDQKPTTRKVPWSPEKKCVICGGN